MCAQQGTLFPKCGQEHAGGLVGSVTHAPHNAHSLKSQRGGR